MEERVLCPYWMLWSLRFVSGYRTTPRYDSLIEEADRRVGTQSGKGARFPRSIKFDLNLTCGRASFSTQQRKIVQRLCAGRPHLNGQIMRQRGFTPDPPPDIQHRQIPLNSISRCRHNGKEVLCPDENDFRNLGFNG